MCRIVVMGLSLMLLSCWGNDDAWKQNLNGTLNATDEVTTLNCIGAEYPDWTTSEYYLPYPKGEAYVIGLGNCDGSYHSPGMPDQFAIDFNMPIGELITACRSGRVLEVVESGRDGGFPNNYVLIGHADGTYAWYMHLTHEGAIVNVGQNVARGGVLGYSGNTGLAGYPHLHLVFTFDRNWPYSSFPVTFKNTIPNESSLQSGVMYPAY